MKKEIYTCDVCGKELHRQFANTLCVYYYQGYPFRDRPTEFSKQWMANGYKHKIVYTNMLCDDCMGVRPDHNYGDNNQGVSFDVMKFLRKVGLLKASQPEEPKS